jgi:hypothetical protein
MSHRSVLLCPRRIHIHPLATLLLVFATTRHPLSPHPRSEQRISANEQREEGQPAVRRNFTPFCPRFAWVLQQSTWLQWHRPFLPASIPSQRANLVRPAETPCCAKKGHDANTRAPVASPKWNPSLLRGARLLAEAMATLFVRKS